MTATEQIEKPPKRKKEKTKDRDGERESTVDDKDETCNLIRNLNSTVLHNGVRLRLCTLAAQSLHFIVTTVRILQHFQNKRISMSFSNATASHNGPPWHLTDCIQAPIWGSLATEYGGI